MFSRVRIAIRFFFMGLAVGILLAPRSGQETRRMVREKADRLLNDVLEAATLGNYESATSGADADIDGATTADRPAAKSGNGRSRSRSATTPSTAQA
jgi:gas vesicle protein